MAHVRREWPPGRPRDMSARTAQRQPMDRPMTEDPRPIGIPRIPDLENKAILVTGASTGIGAAVAHALAQQGARVVIHYRSSQEAAETLVGLITAAGGHAVAIGGDLAADGEAARLVEASAAALGGLDGLINNAGSMLGRVSTAAMTDQHYADVMDLNARSVLAATRSAHPLLKTSRGFIINTTSIAARNGGGTGSLLYAAAKGFVSTLTRGQAKEFAPDGIRVNAVSPGVIATPFHERYSTAEQLAAAQATVPLGRLGTPAECVGAYLFLASAALSGYVTGQIIEVNGGQLMP